MGILTLLVLTGNGVCPWITATFIIKLWDLRGTPPCVFSTVMLSTAVICHVDFANSTSFHVTYPEYDVHPWCTSPSGLRCYWPDEVWGGIRAGNLPEVITAVLYITYSFYVWLMWTECCWDRFFSQYFGFPLSL